MRISLKAGLLVGASILFSACGSASKKADPMEPDPPENKVRTESERNPQPDESIERRKMLERMADVLRTIYFDTDRYVVSEEAKGILAGVGTVMKEYPSIRLEIKGHCDEQGTSEYNLALGDKRANAVRNYLIQYGVSAGELTTTSFGEERPVQIGNGEKAWRLNRRAELKVGVKD